MGKSDLLFKNNNMNKIKIMQPLNIKSRVSLSPNPNENSK